MFTRSIIGAALAADALAQLAANPEQCAHAESGNMRLTIRRTVGGQLNVKCRYKFAYEHSQYREMEREQYLRSPDEQAALNRICTEVWRTAQNPVLQCREALCQMAEAREVPDSWFDSPPIPNTMDYDRMTMDDVKAWTPLVQALPLKVAA